jgi:ATP-dependent RNA helicase DeaD
MLETQPAVCEVGPSFDLLGLDAKILAGVTQAGYTQPTQIQAEIIPVVLEGRDVIAQAKTGSGKTAAFALPAIQMLQFDRTVECLVLTPTRELASQIVSQFEIFGRPRGVRVATIVGGQSMSRQIEQVSRGSQVIVATPGRLLDLLQSGSLKNFSPKMVVLDEADEILDMGFIDDVEKILSYVPEKRQTLLFSATMPPAIMRLAQQQLHEPHRVVLTSAEQRHENISQILYVVHHNEREHALLRIIEQENPEKAIIFCNTKREADDLCKMLNQRKMLASAIHGDLKQTSRNDVVRALKSGQIRLLVATDVASRGLDIQGLSHVFNFHVPQKKERYTHRIGRTGRGSNQGKAITIATPMEFRQSYFLRSQMKMGLTLAEVPSKQEIEASYMTKLLEKIQDMGQNSGAVDHCATIPENQLRDFTSRILSMLLLDCSVDGPESIGLSSKEIQSITSGGGDRIGQGSNRGGSRPSYQGRSGGGGYGRQGSSSGYQSRSRFSDDQPQQGGYRSNGGGRRYS